ncbi:MAG: hypothetical protein ACYC26_07770 [Phycisphaerales bacterium]
MTARKMVWVMMLLMGSVTLTVWAATSTKLEDKFSLNEQQQRAAGSKLGGTTTEQGSAKWDAPAMVVFAGDATDGHVTLRKPDSFVAKLPLPQGKVIRIEADVRVTSANESATWLAVGMGDTGTLTWNDGVFLLLNNGGSYQVFAGYHSKDNKVDVGGGMAAGFKPDGLNHLTLEYHAADNSVQAWVNGILVVKHFVLTEKQFTPGTKFAGVSGYGQSDQAKIDNFSVTVSGD